MYRVITKVEESIPCKCIFTEYIHDVEYSGMPIFESRYEFKDYSIISCKRYSKKLRANNIIKEYLKYNNKGVLKTSKKSCIIKRKLFGIKLSFFI